MMLDKKNNELIKNSLMNANSIININNNHNNINNSVMMSGVVSDNEMINLLNQKISRMTSDYKTLETQVKMYKDEKKIGKDAVQRLQYEVITLKKQLDEANNNKALEPIIGQYKQQIYNLTNEINKVKKENSELAKQKNNNNILDTQNSLKDNSNANDEERNDDGELKAEQL